MKLSQLVYYYNQLEVLSSVPAHIEASRALDEITQQIQNQPLPVLEQFKLQFQQQQDKIDQQFDQYSELLDQAKKQVKDEISRIETAMFQQSYQIYEQEKKNFAQATESRQEHYQQILDRLPEVQEQTQQIYFSRILRYSDWHHAAIILHPGRADFIQHMVDHDPLYLVDEARELLQPALDQFNTMYQQRLRPYVIDEQEDTDILAKIPDNQFGLCLAYNFFNFKPFEVVKQYLVEIYSKLAPGGVIMMTINDCDSYKAVILVEQFFGCYTPGNLICGIAASIGFEKVFSWNDGGPYTWLEFKKPGILNSIKGGQTQAKIMPNPVAKSK
jgi:hypothetical protein